MSIQAYDINLGPAGSNTATQIIEATAQICDFLSSGSAFDQIEVRPNFMQGAAVLKLGQGFDAGALVDRWLIVNKGNTAVSGSVVLSTAGFRNFRISGDVNVLDGSKSRSLANMAYGANVSSAAVAAQFSRAQLWNPASNPNRLIVEAVTVWAAGNANVTLAGNTVQLVTASQLGNPKKMGGTASVAGTFSDSVAAYAAPTLIASYPAVGGQQQVVQIHEPVIVPPGYGVFGICNVANNAMQMNFEWYEEPNT
ncbi:hypothetical protein [Paraburkholderia sediminicola]|uniref:hypothetical protein n=1 Tax=Paraburkholderia sediminicola TaxID=458836 RepID=UPI0038B8401D